METLGKILMFGGLGLMLFGAMRLRASRRGLLHLIARGGLFRGTEASAPDAEERRRALNALALGFAYLGGGLALTLIGVPLALPPSADCAAGVSAAGAIQGACRDGASPGAAF
jgi:hypothetical protein